MDFTRDGIILSVSDSAHIDCLKAKGWDVVDKTAESTPAKAKTPRRKNDD